MWVYYDVMIIMMWLAALLTDALSIQVVFGFSSSRRIHVRSKERATYILASSDS
jgi:hypothetical protein